MRLEEMDFERSKGQRIFLIILFILAYVCGPGILVMYLVSDITDADPYTAPDLWIGAFVITMYAIIAAAILFYVILNAERFSYMEEGMHVRTWRGRRLFAWRDVKKAELTSSRGSTSLMLHYGGLRYISIPLDSYRKSRTLMMEVNKRLPVEIWAADVLWNRVQDV